MDKNKKMLEKNAETRRQLEQKQNKDIELGE